MLCDKSIRFLYKIDKKKTLLFVSLQSELAKQLLPSEYLKNLNTIVYQDENQKLHVKSSAILNVLSNSYPIFKILLVIPVAVGDFFYDIVAQNRYKIFGQKEQCMLDPNVDKSRFIY